MKRLLFVPRPAAWASGVMLFAFATGLRIAMTLVMPILIALLRRSPRLAWLGMLLVWLSPIPAAAALHGFVARTIGLGELEGAGSWWVGLFAWMTIIFVTMTTAFVTLLLSPPPVDPHALSTLAAAVTRGVSGVGPSLLWIALAAYTYELERLAREAG